MIPISRADFLKQYKKNNPSENREEMRKALNAAVKSKKRGTVCHQCKQPIWAIGTAVAGWNSCFACLTGEGDSSKDYEIEDVCFSD